MNRINVIIVDNYKLFRKSLRLNFETRHPDLFVAGEAESGTEFFGLLENTAVDIVLLDINLPDISGIEIARLLKSERPEVKILAISADNAASTTEEMFRTGVEGFLCKENSNGGVIAQAIRSIMQGLDFFGVDASDPIRRTYLSLKKTEKASSEFTQQEMSIIELCYQGLPAKLIADRLGITAKTVEWHKSNIFDKSGIHSTAELIQYALKNGLIKSFLILVLMVISICGFGQNVDSLYRLYQGAKGERRIALVNEMAQAGYATECTDTLFHIDHNTKPELADAIANELVAQYVCYMLNDLVRAVQFSLNAAELYEKMGNISEMNLNLSNAATYYFSMGDYEKAIDLMLKCYELEKQMNDPQAMSATLNDLGVAYSTWGRSEAAIEFFRRALEIERPLNRPMQYARRLGMLAKENATLGNYDEALKLIKEALVYDEKIERNEREERIAVHQKNMGEIYVKMDSLPQAEKCYRYAISVFEKNNRQQPLAESLLGFGVLQMRQHHFTEAIETLKYCIAVGEKYRLRRTLRDACLFLYEAYKQTGHTAQALSYIEQYHHLNDSIFKETTQKQVSEFQVKYETAEKELEILRQRAEINRNNTIRYIFLGIFVVAIVVVLLLIYIVELRNRHNRELTQTNTMKDKFFSIISHDLKNPVFIQRDMLHTLSEHAAQMDTQTLSGFINDLLESSNSLADLLKNLLRWAQIQTGREFYKIVPFNLVDALHAEAGVISSMAQRKNIAFEVQMPATAVVTGNESIIKTVVRNLLANAVKFTQAGGTVCLTVKPADKGKYTVLVGDTGVGMNKEQRYKLFRLDSAQSRKGTAGEQGSGLGLIICKELLEKCGSFLRVESEEGKGSRFWFVV